MARRLGVLTILEEDESSSQHPCPVAYKCLSLFFERIWRLLVSTGEYTHVDTPTRVHTQCTCVHTDTQLKVK